MFVVTVPRPQVLAVSHGIIRDLTLACDPSALLGQMIALYSAPQGDHRGYRNLARLLAGTALEGTSVSEVRAACPKRAVVGLARIGGVERALHGYRVHLVEARPVRPILVPMVAPEVWALPWRWGRTEDELAQGLFRSR